MFILLDTDFNTFLLCKWNFEITLKKLILTKTNYCSYTWYINSNFHVRYFKSTKYWICQKISPFRPLQSYSLWWNISINEVINITIYCTKFDNMSRNYFYKYILWVWHIFFVMKGIIRYIHTYGYHIQMYKCLKYIKHLQ